MVIDTSRLADWQHMQAQNKQQKSGVDDEDILYGGGGGGPVDPKVPLKDYVDARDDAVESRLTQKLDKLPTKGTIWAAAATIIATILAVLAFAGDRFDSGLSLASQQAEQIDRDAKQDKAVRDIKQILDERLPPPPTKP